MMDVLRNEVQHYAWGSTTAIPSLLGEQPDGTPQAEVWMGAHPSAPSHISRGGSDLALDAVIAADPVAELGASCAREFDGRLPFLVKLLAAGDPLSLQAHPALEQAQAGFARENAAGVPMDAPDRLYHDANHKPEILCALTEFTGLCGFRPVHATADLLRSLQSERAVQLADTLEENGLRAAVTALLRSAPHDRASFVDEIVAACGHVPTRAELVWTQRLAQQYPADIGVVVALLLNLVTVQPGQALYLGAGNLHAYLGGLGVEVMANSDNVLRGGLTPKHVDPEELLAVLDFAPLDDPNMIPHQVSDGLAVFDTPVPDFRLWVHTLAVGQVITLNTTGPEIVVCTHGEVLADGESLAQGRSAYSPAGRTYTLEARTSGSVVHRTTAHT